MILYFYQSGGIALSDTKDNKQTLPEESLENNEALMQENEETTTAPATEDIDCEQAQEDVEAQAEEANLEEEAEEEAETSAQDAAENEDEPSEEDDSEPAEEDVAEDAETTADTDAEAEEVSEEYNPKKCVACQKNIREEGSYYCPDCRTEMLKTKLRVGPVLAAVFSVILSFTALVLFAFNCAQALPLLEANILVQQGYVNAAMNSVSQAEDTTASFNDVGFVETLSELFGKQKIFTLGNASHITTAKIYAKGYTEVDAGGYLVQQLGEEEVLSNPLFIGVRKYVREYKLYNSTQEAVYNYFAPYETVGASEVPYEAIIEKLNALEGKEGISAHYLEYYKCYAAILANKGHDVQNEYLLNMEKLYPDGILIYGSLIADNYARLGQYPKAIEYADKMLAQNKNYSPAYELKFTSYMAMNKFEEAEAVCNAVAQANNKAGTDNGDYTEYSLRARLQWAQGKYDDALTTCEEGIEISGGDAEIYRQQAIVYLFKGDYAKAAESADNAYQFAYYSSALDLQTLNTAALCAGLAKNDELYTTMEDLLKTYGYEVSNLVKDCIAGKITVEEVFSSVGGDVL